ncbi:MAG: polysialyltransferase family glycosyltransferase [Ruminococcus sp.]
MGKVLYHAVSSYQLLEVMLHRMVYHPGEQAVLILPDFIREKYPAYRKLEKQRFFDRVYLFPYLYIPHDSEEEIEKRVRRYCEKVIPWDIRSFDEIYVAGAHFYFSLYLISHKIPFCFFEDGAGMATRPEKLYRNLRRQYPLHAQIAEAHGLFDGSSPWVKKIICLKKAQKSSDISGKKYQDFHVERQLAILNKKERRKVIHFFIRHKIWTRARGILLTQNFSGLGIMSCQRQMRIYQTLAQETLRDTSLIIKKHPDDRMDYRDVFPEARIIKAVFPSELLPYVFWKRPKIIYTFDSTGCENLKEHFFIRKLKR